MDNQYRRLIEYTDTLFENEISSKKSLPPYLVNLYGLMILKKINRLELAKVTYEERALYQIVVHVRLLQNLLNWFVNSRFSYREIEDTCKQLIQIIHSELINLLTHLPNPLPFSFDPVCEKLRFDVRELLFLEGAFKHKILHIYWYLWKHLFRNTNLRKEELSFAEDTAKKGTDDSSWQFAYMFQLFLAGRAEDSLILLKKTGIHHLPYAISFMNYYMEIHYEQGVKNIIHFLIQNMKEYFEEASYDDKQHLADELDEITYQYVKETDHYDLYEQLLITMFPFTARALSSLYFERKEYGKLMDFLQITNNGYLSSEILRTIQKEDPKYLLPYYHRKVQQAIEQKNRKSYKEAVRDLKKLRTIYKKIKKEETWKQFFDQLLEETKRLRAFQEECQRGKLIDVEDETA